MIRVSPGFEPKSEAQRFGAYREFHWFKSCCRAFVLRAQVGENALTMTAAIPFVCMLHLTLNWSKPCWFKCFLRKQYPADPVDSGLRIDKFGIHWQWRDCFFSWSDSCDAGYSKHFYWRSLREMPRVKILSDLTTSGVTLTQPRFGDIPASEHQVDITITTFRLIYRRPWNRNRVETRVSIFGFSDPPIISKEDEYRLWGFNAVIPKDVLALGEKEMMKFAVNEYSLEVQVRRLQYV